MSTVVVQERPEAFAGGARRPLDASRVGRFALDAMAALSLGFILLPLVLVTWLAFFRQEIPSFPPEGYSVRWFGAVFNTAASSAAFF